VRAEAVALGLGIMLLASAAAAQSVPPTDLEIMQARAQAGEARSEYLAMILRRAQAEEAKTAKWWADYIGLKPEPPQAKNE
jgi:hypothetical protein